MDIRKTARGSHFQRALATYPYLILMAPPEENAVCAPSRGSRVSLPTHQNGYSLLYANIDAFSQAPRLVSVLAVHRLPSEAGYPPK